MPIESAQYLNQLDPSNPAATDSLSQADDHLRLIKSTLKATFPNVGGAVTVTHTDLNKVSTMEARLTGITATKFDKTGGAINGAVTLIAGDFDVNNGKVMERGSVLIPHGVIVMWSGPANQIPPGWALCNGQVVNGVQTPDLRDRFVAGAGGNYSAWQVGGSAGGNVVTSQSGAHGHTVSEVGGHSHGGQTHGHAITLDQMPAHDHNINSGSFIAQLGGGQHAMGAPTPFVNQVQFMGQGGNQPHAHGMNPDGGHSHGISIEGSHAHTVNFDNRPPFLALAYILKL